MSPTGHVVVMALDTSMAAQLADTVESEGYRIAHVPTPADVLSMVGGESTEPVAVLVDDASMPEVDVLLRTATESMPGARFIVAVPNGRPDVSTPATGWPGASQVLCLSGASDPAENVREVRIFLRGEGYRWASDMAVTVSRDVPLLGASSRHGRRPEDQSDKLLAFVNELSRLTDADAMLREALRRYLDLLRCDAGSLYVWDDRADVLILKAAEGPEADQRVGLRQKLGEGFAGWVAKVRDSILVTDARKVQRMSGRTSRRYSSLSCLGTPVMHGERLFGVVCLTRTEDGTVFEPEDLLLAQSLSQKLGSLMRPLMLLTELRMFNERLLEVMEGCSDWLMEKNTQMEAMRALSSDILDSIPLAVIAYDRRLRICFTNTAAQVLLGEQPVRKPGGEYVPLQDMLDMEPAEWRQKLLSVVQDADEFRLLRAVCRAEPARRVLDIHCSPLQDSAGATIAGILTVQDVTEDVEMEEKLFSAEKLALVGKIAARVAHELNNPLDGILRFLGLATRLMEAEPDKARTYLEESRRGLLRMSHILTQLLAFSRSHRGAGRPVSLSQIIRDSLSLYEKRAEATNIEIRLDVAPDLPHCLDAELCQVFSNVIKNALDAMSQDGVLTVRAVEDNGYVRVFFSDTGPGVPEDIRDKILEPFFTTKKDGTGTGLGLAACVDSLGRIGGEIKLCPSEQGAVFEVVVPVERAEE